MDENVFKIISRILCVKWHKNEKHNQIFKVETKAVIKFIETTLKENIFLIINACDYESALKIYNNLKSNRISINENYNFEFPEIIFESKDQSVLALCYLLQCYRRVSIEEKTAPDDCTDLLANIRFKCIDFSALVLTNPLTTCTDSPNRTSILAQFLLTQCLPNGFISALVCSTYRTKQQNNNFKVIFVPLLQTIRQEMIKNIIINKKCDYAPPLRSLNDLCQIKESADGNRPICQLVSILFENESNN
jgi:hypothetical protein